MNKQTESLVRNQLINISITSMLAVGYIAGLVKNPGIVLALVGGLFLKGFAWQGICLWRGRRDKQVFTMSVHVTE